MSDRADVSMATDYYGPGSRRSFSWALNLDRQEYINTVNVRSDDDSDLAQHLQYFSKSSHDANVRAALARLDPTQTISLSFIAAFTGDLNFLDFMYNKFGGVIYDQRDAAKALKNRCFEYFTYYVQLSYGTCYSYDNDHDHDEVWYHPILLPLFDILDDWLSTADRDRFFVQIFENVFPFDLPSKSVYQHYLQWEQSHLPAAQIRSMVAAYGDDNNYPVYLAEKRLLRWVLCNDQLFENIRKYLVEIQGMRFDTFHLADVALTGHRRLFEYVQAHLDPDLEPEWFTDMPTLMDITRDDLTLLSALNKEFFEFLAFYSIERGLYRDPDVGRRDLVELFYGRSEIVPKLNSIVAFLRSNEFPNHSTPDFRSIVSFKEAISRAAFGYDPETSANWYAGEMANHIVDVLNLMSNRSYEGFEKIDWVLAAEVDFSRCNPIRA